jgi:hypothetical protein
MHTAALTWLRDRIQLFGITRASPLHRSSFLCVNAIPVAWTGHRFHFTFLGHFVSHDSYVQDREPSSLEPHILTRKQFRFPASRPRTCPWQSMVELEKYVCWKILTHGTKFNLVYGEGILLDPRHQPDAGTFSGAWWICL